MPRIHAASCTVQSMHNRCIARSATHLTPGHLHLLQSAKIVSSVCSRRTYMLLLSAVYYVAVNRDPTRVQPHRPIKNKIDPSQRLTSIAAYFMSVSAPAFVAAYTPPPRIAGRVETRDPEHEDFTIIDPLFPHFAIAGICVLGVGRLRIQGQSSAAVARAAAATWVTTLRK